MCAINGITTEDRDAVLLMNKATAHRGPDATGCFVSENMTMGHNRLSIIDVSESANQPMYSPDGRLVLVFNGEIYNFKELRSELKDGWEFKTNSDSEVILAGFSKWGDGLLNRLRGIFAFAIWDKSSKELMLVRDQMGVKPLYYALAGNHLLFSSELGGITAGLKTTAQVSSTSLAYYLSLNYIPSPATLVDDVYKLRPGHWLKYKEGSVKVERYWYPEKPEKKRGYQNVDLPSVIDSVVKRQLVSDRPVGLFLSGGLDSSIVLHHATKHVDQVRTFSIDFEMVAGSEAEAGKFNSDAALAEQTADFYKAKHTKFTLELDEFEKSFLSIVESLDEPIANASAISRYILSKKVREEGVVVALGGDGGDDLFGGYTRQKLAAIASIYQAAPKVVRAILESRIDNCRKLGTEFGAPMHMRLMSLKSSRYGNLLRLDNIDDVVKKLFAERYSELSHMNLPVVDQFMRVDRETWLADESLAETDRTSMANSLEVRVPLLDLDLVAASDKLYADQKFKPWSTKQILRQAYRRHLPDYLFNQPKRGWLSPGAKWLRQPAISKLAKEVLSAGYYKGLDRYVDFDEAQRLLSDHINNNSYHLFPIWNLVILQIWARKQGLKF